MSAASPADQATVDEALLPKVEAAFSARDFVVLEQLAEEWYAASGGKFPSFSRRNMEVYRILGRGLAEGHSAGRHRLPVEGYERLVLGTLLTYSEGTSNELEESLSLVAQAYAELSRLQQPPRIETASAAVGTFWSAIETRQEKDREAGRTATSGLGPRLTVPTVMEAQRLIDYCLEMIRDGVYENEGFFLSNFRKAADLIQGISPELDRFLDTQRQALNMEAGNLRVGLLYEMGSREAVATEYHADHRPKVETWFSKAADLAREAQTKATVYQAHATYLAYFDEDTARSKSLELAAEAYRLRPTEEGVRDTYGYVLMSAVEALLGSDFEHGEATPDKLERSKVWLETGASFSHKYRPYIAMLAAMRLSLLGKKEEACDKAKAAYSEAVAGKVDYETLKNHFAPRANLISKRCGRKADFNPGPK